MKKNFFVKIFAVLLFCAASNVGLQAQDTFTRGDKVINLGIGLGSNLSGAGFKSSVPPLSGSFEYGLIGNLFNNKSSFGIGGYVGYAADKWKKTSLGHNYVILGVRGSFHYQFADRLDTYLGVMGGYNIVRLKGYDDTKISDVNSGFAYSFYLGSRYYLLEKLAAFAEIGYGISFLQLGLAYKF